MPFTHTFCYNQANCLFNSLNPSFTLKSLQEAINGQKLFSTNARQLCVIYNPKLSQKTCLFSNLLFRHTGKGGRGASAHPVFHLEGQGEQKCPFMNIIESLLDVDMMPRRSNKLYKQAICDWKREQFCEIWAMLKDRTKLSHRGVLGPK